MYLKTRLKQKIKGLCMCIFWASMLFSALFCGYVIGDKKAIERIQSHAVVLYSANYLYYISQEPPDRVVNIYNQIIKHVPIRGVVTEIRYLDDGVENAYATYGGAVYVTKGLVEKAKNDDELALIIGHEIAHVVLNHVSNKDDSDSRIQEMSADKLGLFLAIQAGYNPCSAVMVYVRWHSTYGMDVATTSHPDHLQRYVYLQLPQCR